jgi:hemin uptake protein HemP
MTATDSAPKLRPAAKPAVPTVNAEHLFGPSQELRITFRGAEYRLRITRQGKLILTK